MLAVVGPSGPTTVDVFLPMGCGLKPGDRVRWVLRDAVTDEVLAEQEAVSQALPGWLRERLLVQASSNDLDAALGALQTEGVLDVQGHLQAEQLSDLVDEWVLRAWVREARRADEDQG